MSALVTPVAWADRQAGDVGVLRGTGVISDAIVEGARIAGEIKDGTEWSHCFIVGIGKIFEAIFPKIALSPWNVYEGQRTALFRINVDDTIKQSALHQLIYEYVGRGYDLAGVALGMAGLEIAHALDLPIDINFWARKHEAWCSELDMRDVNKLIPSSIDPTTLSPQGFYNHMRSL